MNPIFVRNLPKFHEENLGMKRCMSDPCFTYKTKQNIDNKKTGDYDLPDIAKLQVGGCFGVGSETFFKREEQKGKHFKTNARIHLGRGNKLRFNGIHIARR